MLNTEQQAAVDAADKQLLVLAGAGTGKTYTMISRITKLVSAGAPVNHILVLTFTNAAAAEMKDRYASTHVNEPTPMFCTFHSFCYSLIARDIEILKRLGYTQVPNLPDEPAIKRIEASVKQQCGTKLSSNKLHGHDILTPKEQFQYDIFWKQFEKILKKENYITFDTMCYSICELFDSDDPLIAKYKEQYEYLFVDEVQDTDPKQWKFVSSFKNAHLFVVGDAKQCQPAGTPVLISPKKTMPIESLASGNSVFTLSDSDLSASTEPVNGHQRKVLAAACNTDTLITVHSDKITTKYTPNHITYAKLHTEGNESRRIVYLMRNERGWYRIGTITLYITKGNLFTAMRNALASNNGSDVWVLSYTTDREVARALENQIANTYHIPRVSWCGTMSSAGDSLKTMYGVLGDITREVSSCLKKFHRLLKYPMFSFKQSTITDSVFQVHACNLLPDFFDIVVPVAARYETFNITYKQITWIDYSAKEELVYSLDVEEDHSYIADGVYTHNSIYGFRGADSTIIKSLAKDPEWHTIKLSENYRSTSQICEFANKIHKSWEGQPFNLQIHSDSNGCKVINDTMFDIDDAKSLLGLVSSCNDTCTSAILCRTNAEVSDVSLALSNIGVPHCTKPSSSMSDVKHILRSISSDSYMVDWLSSKIRSVEYNEYVRLTAIDDKYATAESFIELYGNRFSAQLQTVMDARKIINSSLFAYGKCASLCDLLKLPNSEIKLAQDSTEAILSYLTVLADSMCDASKLYVGTIHSVKGLEFDIVHILNVGGRSFQITDEEQYNLYYVACTRAKSKLYIWHSNNY